MGRKRFFGFFWTVTNIDYSVQGLWNGSSVPGRSINNGIVTFPTIMFKPVCYEMREGSRLVLALYSYDRNFDDPRANYPGLRHGRGPTSTTIYHDSMPYVTLPWH